MCIRDSGYTYDDITKWGGAHTAVSANDRVGMFQDGTLNAYLTLGPGQQSHIQELVLNAKVKWLPVSGKVLKSVTAKTGQSIGVIPADFYGCLLYTSSGYVGRGPVEGLRARARKLGRIRRRRAASCVRSG